VLTFQGYRYLSTEKDLKEELGHQSYDTSNFAADETDVNKERSIAAVEGASFNFNFFLWEEAKKGFKEQFGQREKCEVWELGDTRVK